MTPFVYAAGGMTLAALAALAWPLIGRHRRRGASETSHEVAIYRDQLAEIDRDLERGLVRPEEATAAKVEVERRLLRTAAGTSAQPVLSRRGGVAALLVAVVLVPALTAALYLRVGEPDRPDEPLAGRQIAADQAGGGGAAASPQVQEMVARLEARLKDQPNDLQGWLLLARSRAALDDPPAAVAAYRRAIALGPDNVTAQIGLAEALVAIEGGMVTPEAKSLFDRAAPASGGDPRPAYYLGLADAQAGDGKAAVERWRALLASAPAEAPWRPRVEEAIRSAASGAGIDADAALADLPKAPPAAAPAPASATPGPGPGDVAAAESMTPEQRTGFIRDMVGRLEAKLAADGSDVEGWQRLAQARLVLGEQDKARAAFERGLALHPDDATLLKGYAGLMLQPPADEGGLPKVGDDAARLYARAAAAAPDDPEAQWFLGIRALQTGKKDEARDHWQRVLARLGPSEPDYGFVKQQLDKLGS